MSEDQIQVNSFLLENILKEYQTNRKKSSKEYNIHNKKNTIDNSLRIFVKNKNSINLYSNNQESLSCEKQTRLSFENLVNKAKRELEKERHIFDYEPYNTINKKIFNKSFSSRDEILEFNKYRSLNHKDNSVNNNNLSSRHINLNDVSTQTNFDNSNELDSLIKDKLNLINNQIKNIDKNMHYECNYKENLILKNSVAFKKYSHDKNISYFYKKLCCNNKHIRAESFTESVKTGSALKLPLIRNVTGLLNKKDSTHNLSEEKVIGSYKKTSNKLINFKFKDNTFEKITRKSIESNCINNEYYHISNQLYNKINRFQSSIKRSFVKRSLKIN